MTSVLRGRRPWLAAGVLAIMAAALLWPTRAVPLTSVEAATPHALDDNAAAADALAVQAVLRVRTAVGRQGWHPTTA